MKSLTYVYCSFADATFLAPGDRGTPWNYGSAADLRILPQLSRCFSSPPLTILSALIVSGRVNAIIRSKKTPLKKKKRKTHALARALLNKEWRLCQKGRPVNIAIKPHFRTMLFKSPTWAKFLHLLSLFWTRGLSALSKVCYVAI